MNKNSAAGIVPQIEFDIALEEEKPFLKNLFDLLTENLNDGLVISEIKHLEYRERYTIGSKNGNCVIDFEYNRYGFFGRVLPLENKCSNPLILEKVKEIMYIPELLTP